MLWHGVSLSKACGQMWLKIHYTDWRNASRLSPSLSGVERLSNEILNLRSNICLHYFLLMFLRWRQRSEQHIGEVQDKTECYLSVEPVNRSNIFHINNCTPSTCCSHRFCSRDSSRALILIQESTMINFLWNRPKCSDAWQSKRATVVVMIFQITEFFFSLVLLLRTRWDNHHHRRRRHRYC